MLADVPGESKTRKQLRLEAKRILEAHIAGG
jgi:hypothetical protein